MTDLAVHPTAARTLARPLLAAGFAAGPLFLGTAAAQMAGHADFDPRRHPISLLSLGAHGWIQIANFVLTGLLVLAFAVGVRRALHPGPAGTWGPILLAGYGIGLIVGGVFVADPANGYPVGAVEGTTAHGVVHNIAPALSGVLGLVAYGVFARRFAKLGRRGWVAATVGTAAVLLALNVTATATMDFRLMFAGTVVGFAWLAALAVHLWRPPA
jgi:hypothetical membrane protein